MYRRFKSKLVIFFTVINISLSFGQAIKGKLLDVNNTPIPGLLVVLDGTNDYSENTNGLGIFRFNGIKKGRYKISIDDERYSIQSIEIDYDGKQIDLGEILVKENSGNTKTNDIEIISIEDLQQITDDDVQAVSSVLTSGRDPFDEAAAFNLGSGRFRARGYNNEETEVYFNGMPANDLDDGRVFFNSWGGLNDVTRSQTNILSMKNSDYAFGGLRGSTFIDMRASVQKVQDRVTYSYGNRSFRHRLMYTKSTGMQENGWAFSASLSRRWANSGFVKGTHFDSYGYYAAVDKKLNEKNTLSLMVLGAPLRRGKTAATVKEMYDLAKDNLYNSNWGYQNGEVRNSREDRINQPIVSLRHDLTLNRNTRIMTTLGYQFGKNGSTRLDWNEAADPRPDYYRKLPSFVKNEDAKNDIINFFQASEANRQVNWDLLYEINRNRIATIKDVDGIAGKTETGKSSSYILVEQRFDVKKLSLNSIINSNLTDRLTFTGGINLLSEKNHNFQILDDLLGGDFFIDFDDFALRDYPDDPRALQNDLNRPNRLVKKGDVVGYDYDLNTSNYNTWGQILYIGNKHDLFLSAKIDYLSFYREGYMKNGRFPESSFGKSTKNNFFTYAIKAGETYKLDGRNYLYINGGYKTRAPFSRFAYLSPRIKDATVKNLTTEKIASVELGYIFKLSNVSGRLTAYSTQFNDQIENVSFYHDELQTFVNYVTNDISKNHSGIEFGMNATLNTRFSVEASLALGRYVYTNRPFATITQDNSPRVIAENKTIYLKNFFVPSTPQTAGTVGVNYSSPKFWGCGFNVNYFDNNYVDINFDRRTIEAVDLVSKTENPEKYKSIINQEKLPAAYTVDFYARKSWRVWKRNILALNFNIGNLLDKRDFVTSGFEQGRFNFSTKDVNEFPNRYWYAFGRNFGINLSYTF